MNTEMLENVTQELKRYLQKFDGINNIFTDDLEDVNMHFNEYLFKNNLKDLKYICKAYGIRRYSSKTKIELVNLLKINGLYLTKFIEEVKSAQYNSYKHY